MYRIVNVLTIIALFMAVALPGNLHAQAASDAGAHQQTTPYGIERSLNLSSGTLTYIEVAPD